MRWPWRKRKAVDLLVQARDLARPLVYEFSTRFGEEASGDYIECDMWIDGHALMGSAIFLPGYWSHEASKEDMSRQRREVGVLATLDEVKANTWKALIGPRFKALVEKVK
jgi:hypothetical protein